MVVAVAVGVVVDIAEIEVFLVLAEELHFGRTAERLRVPQPRVSRLIARLERRVGGALFDRTSRRVCLTPLGEQVRGGLRSGYEQITATIEAARAATRGIAGLLRVGCLVTQGGPDLTRLVEQFCAHYPDCDVRLQAVPTRDPYGPLRRGEIDVLVGWLVVAQPDLTAGPAVMYRDRVLHVGLGHRLAGRESVCVEDLGGEEVHDIPATFPSEVYDAIVPSATPSGRPIRWAYPWDSDEDVLTAVARGRIVHPGVTGATLATRPDLAEIPIRDLPPMPFGLIWCTARENARIRALATTATAVRPAPTRP